MKRNYESTVMDTENDYAAAQCMCVCWTGTYEAIRTRSHARCNSHLLQIPMKVLFISNDPTIFDATSAARADARIATLVEELHILSPARLGAVEEQERNLYLHPVHVWKIFVVRALTKRAHALILQYNIEVVSAQDPFEHGLAALRACAAQMRNCTFKCTLIFSPRGS